MYAKTNYQWSGDAVYRTRNSVRYYIVRHIVRHIHVFALGGNG